MKNGTNRLAAKQESGLDLAGLGDLAAMLEAPVGKSNQGAPMMVDMDRVREDEANSRTEGNPGFSDESIAELAESMSGGRGVKSPLSLRPDANAQGFYIINHGHRRYRAAKVAGLTQVPAFIDEGFDKFDQVIENIHREALTPREIADFIGIAQAEGHTLTEIARLLGKSKAFVSQHAVLLDLPEPVAKAFHEGQVKDVTLVNELVRAHRENPQEVEATIAESSRDGLAAKQLTRTNVKALRKHTSDTPEKVPKVPKAESSTHWSDLTQKLSALPGITAKSDVLADGSLALCLLVSGDEAIQTLAQRLGIDVSSESQFSG